MQIKSVKIAELKTEYGELSEWSKVQHSKCCVGKLT